MPIRASDKCYGNAINGPGEMACLPLATVMDHVHRIAFGHPHITYAIVTSEDATAITESKVTEAMANLTDSYRLAIVRNVGDKPPGSGSPRNRTADASNAVLLKSSLVTLHLQALA